MLQTATFVEGTVSGYRGSVNRGHSELVVQWKYRNRGSVNSEHKGPEEQWALWTSVTMGAEDQ